VVRNDSGIQKPEDFHGKKVASPQMGNTQDSPFAAWLIAHGMKSTDKARRAGDSAGESDQLTLFMKKNWTDLGSEPWHALIARKRKTVSDERDLCPTVSSSLPI